MENDYPKHFVDRDLFLAIDRKMDKVKDHISDLYQRDNANKERIERAQARIDKGVSVTGNRNSEGINALNIKQTEAQNLISNLQTTVGHLEKVVGRIMAGLFWMSFAGVMGGLLGLAYHVLKLKIGG